MNFANDYSRSAHPRILEALLATQGENNPGYGTDQHCRAASDMIRQACQAPEAEVIFLTGGTQTNQVVLDCLLDPTEGVLCADTGHIAVHEAGAIEATGRKVITLPAADGGMSGKVDPAAVRAWLETFAADENNEHMTPAGALYISQPTEFGALYSRAELEELRAACDEYGLKMFVDGARLAYCEGAEGHDATLADLARCADAFYIGGTKCGALFGEAVVFPRQAPTHVMRRVKRRGALLAKGWLLGLQFEALFGQGSGDKPLYLELGERATVLANRIRAAIARDTSGRFELVGASVTNQIFLRLPNHLYRELGDRVGMSFWESDGVDHTIVRIATAWYTSSEDVGELLEVLGLA